jgi:uncharacterized protein (TIGR03790 family)
MRNRKPAGILGLAAAAGLGATWLALSAPNPDRRGAGATPSAPPVAAVPTAGGDDPATVLVVYRSNCPDFNKNGMGDSEEIARYYAQRRGVPASNLLGVKVDAPGTDIFNKFAAWPYDAFQRQLIQPIRAKLTALGPSKVLYIVTVFGLPMRVNAPVGNKQYSADAALSNPFLTRDDGLHPRAFYVARANASRYTAPRFAVARARWEGSEVKDNISYLVTRLDGIGAPNAKALVDGALYAEKYDVDGYAYVDTRFGTYTDEDLKTWRKLSQYLDNTTIDPGIALTREFFQDAGLTVRQQPDNDVIGASDTLKFTDGTSAAEAPRALAYAGWYNYGQYKNVWDWLPGSVAMDFDSASLFAPRQVMGSFDGMALLNGASGAVGCFTEPYSVGHPMPDVLFYYYTHGYNFAEASWLASPNQPFVNLAIGDPLMRPYGRKRVPDTKLEAPKVTWKKDGQTLEATVRMPGDVEIARARLAVLPRKDDALLPPCTRHDGVFRREMTFTAPIPASGPSFASLVLTDPAGNTLRIWKPAP